MQIFRISIDSKEKSSEAKVLEKKLNSLGYNISLEISKVYTIQHDFSEDQIKKIADSLHNPVVAWIGDVHPLGIVGRTCKDGSGILRRSVPVGSSERIWSAAC